MNLQQLEYFKAVADLGHMTQAANQLHISQPALSMAISSLEVELGIPLFSKIGRRITLTEYGKIFLSHISGAIQKIEIAKQEIRQMELSENKTLHISSTYSLGISLIPQLIRDFKKKFPDVIIHLKQAPNMELIQDVTAGNTDFVFGRIIPDDNLNDRLQFTSLYTENLVILMSSEHRLANCSHVFLDTLKEEDFVFFHESTGFHQLVLGFFQDADFQPNIRYEVYDNSACASLVSANLGIALIAPTSIYNPSKLYQASAMTEKGTCDTTVYLTWNKMHDSPSFTLHREFLNFTWTYFKKSDSAS